jgi:GT2 family glycosyltransferase
VNIVESPAICAVIVNYDDGLAVQRQLQAYAADDLERFNRWQWIVIHNGPPPVPSLSHSDPAIDRALRQVKIQLTANEGYGSAINRAFFLTDAPFLLALNADLLPTPGFLAGLEQVVEELGRRCPHPHCTADENPYAAGRVGMVGFRLLNPNGTLQGSAGRLPTLRRVVMGLIQPRATRKYVHTIEDRPTEVPWLTGACLLLSRECLNEIGTFDEQYFMYYEDVDLCERARQAGWKIFHDPRWGMIHFNPYHRRALTHRMVFMARHGLLTYFWKHRPRWEWKTLLVIVLAECRFRQWSRNAADREGWKRVETMIRWYREAPNEHHIDAGMLP